MGHMNIPFPDVVIIGLRFKGYDVRGSDRSKPNDVRRWLMDLEKAPLEPLPRLVSKKIGISKEDIIPYSFSLIKEPTKLPGKRRFKGSAIGAIAIYLYSGSSAKFEELCNGIKEILEQVKNTKSLSFSEYEIFVAKRWPYV